MFLHQDESFGKPGNYLFDEGIAYCRKQQFEKAYQCFKKHLAQNSFCQETFQMLSYCHYKFSENLRNNVSDLSIITKHPKFLECSFKKNKKVNGNVHSSSSAVLQNFTSAKSNNFQGKFDSEKQQKLSSNLRNSPASNKKQRSRPFKSESPAVFSETVLHKVEKSVTVESCEINHCDMDQLVEQMVNRQSKIELFLKNIDHTLSNVELEINALLTKEKKVNSDVLSLLSLVAYNSSVFKTETCQNQAVYFTGVYLNNLPMFCQPQEFATYPASWLFPYKMSDELPKSGDNYCVVYNYNVKNELEKSICGKNTTLVSDSCCFRQENSTIKKPVLVQSAAQLSPSSPSHDRSSKREKPVGDASFVEQNFSNKRKLDFSDADFPSSPQKKLQMSTLLNKAMAKRKSDDAIEADDLKRQKIQRSNQCSGKLPLLNCRDTFKMLKELPLMRDLSVCDIDSGRRSVFLGKTFRRAQPACEGISLKTMNHDFFITKNTAVQTELSISRNSGYLGKFSSNLRCSSGTVSLLHSNSIIPTNFHNKKFQVPVSTNSACAQNCLNTFIYQILHEIKDSLSFIPMDFVPMNSSPDSTSIGIQEVKLMLVPARGRYFTDYSVLRLCVRGHYIEFPNMRVYQVDPFSPHHSTCDNSLVTCRDQSLSLSEPRSQNQSPFVYPVCILLHSLSTDLYNFTLLAGPFRIRFVNFNSYFNVTPSSSFCDN